LDKEYGQVDWRLALARCLAKTGDVNPAIHEVRICLRLRPASTPAKQLLGQLVVMPGANDEQP
jgi:hypothetical protein